MKETIGLKVSSKGILVDRVKQQRTATCIGVLTAYHRIIAAIKYHSGGVQMAPDHLDDFSDEELVQRIGSGDLAAYNVLDQRYRNLVYRWAMTKVGPEDAEDIRQETFLKAYQHLSTSRSLVFNFKSWLSKIAKNTSIDHLRKQGREPPKELDDKGMAQQSPEDAFIFREGFQEAMEKLNYREREILYLSSQDYTDEEIAQRLMLSSRSVGTYRSNARRKLRQILFGKGFSN